MAREIGISKIHLYPIQADDILGTTYDQGFAVPWAVSLESTINYAESAYYADNIQEFSSKMVTSIDLTLEMSSDVDPETDALITGRHFKDGFGILHANAIPKAHALAYEVKMDNGNVRRYCFYKCTLTRDSQSNETVGDSVTSQTFTYNGSGSALISNGAFMLVMDKELIDAMSPGAEKDEAERAWNEFFDTSQGTNVVLP